MKKQNLVSTGVFLTLWHIDFLDHLVGIVASLQGHGECSFNPSLGEPQQGTWGQNQSPDIQILILVRSVL